MKNNSIKNLKVLAAGLCLSVGLLTGCSNDNEIVFGQSKIDYESVTPEGTISYEDLNNCGKIVTLEQNGVTIHKVLMKTNYNFVAIRGGSSYNEFNYYDLSSGTRMIGYRDYVSKTDREWIVGENLTIIGEQDITSYLLQENFIKKEYAVEDVLTFFEEKIKPTLDSNKELIK